MWEFIAVLVAQTMIITGIMIKTWNRVNLHTEQIADMRETFYKERDQLNNKLDKINDNLQDLTNNVSELVGVLKGHGFNVSRD